MTWLKASLFKGHGIEETNNQTYVVPWGRGMVRDAAGDPPASLHKRDITADTHEGLGVHVAEARDLWDQSGGTQRTPHTGLSSSSSETTTDMPWWMSVDL